MLTHLRDHLTLGPELRLATLDECAEQIAVAGGLLSEVINGGGKMLICGNGGSAADAQHMAAELVGRLHKDERRGGIAALALTTDTSFLTAHANDESFATVFERQVDALGRSGDALVSISTSGGSENVLRATRLAAQKGLRTVALTGGSGDLANMAEVAVRVPHSDTQLIQEVFLAIEHLLCAWIINSLPSEGVAQA
jgi:D-sedoheptulose 7-phosphate isomerase